MFHQTGAGKIKIYVDHPVGGEMKAMLYNFDFDDYAGHRYRPLKVEHQGPALTP